MKSSYETTLMLTNSHTRTQTWDGYVYVCLSVGVYNNWHSEKQTRIRHKIVARMLFGWSICFICNNISSCTLLQLPLYAASSSVAAGPASVACCTCNRNTTIISGTDVTLALDVLRLLSCSQLSSLWLFEKFVCLPCAMLHSGVN